MDQGVEEGVNLGLEERGRRMVPGCRRIRRREGVRLEQDNHKLNKGLTRV